jgi:hypothetical protein
LHPLLERASTAAVDLPQAGDAWADGEAAAPPIFSWQRRNSLVVLSGQLGRCRRLAGS